MKIQNKIITVLFITLFLLLGAQTVIAQTIDGILDISDTSCSGTTAYNSPPSNLFDSNFSSAWKLTAGSENGWVEAEFDDAAFVYGIELTGTITADTVLRVQFLQNNQWYTYSGGDIGPGNYGSTFFDFSYNRVITEKIRVILDGHDVSACEVREISVKGKYRKDILSIAPVKNVKSSENSSFMYPPENLIDGSVYTEWKTATSYHGFKSDYDKKSDSIKNFHFRNGSESKCLPPYRSESSVEFELEKEILLESIQLYFSKETKGDIEIHAKNGRHWEYMQKMADIGNL